MRSQVWDARRNGVAIRDVEQPEASARSAIGGSFALPDQLVVNVRRCTEEDDAEDADDAPGSPGA